MGAPSVNPAHPTPNPADVLRFGARRQERLSLKAADAPRPREEDSPMFATDPVEPATPETDTADQAADPPAPARKPRKPRAKSAAGGPDEIAAPGEPAPVAADEPAPAEPAADAEAPPAADAVPAEELVRGEQFAKMLGLRPAELIAYERKGWLRPVEREQGASLYRKSDAPEIRQDLKRRQQEESDQRRRQRRYWGASAEYWVLGTE